MGGIGSGPWGGTGSRYLATDQCYSLDLASLKRVGYFSPGMKADGTRRWTNGNDPEPRAEVAIEIDLRDLERPTYTIRYKSGDEPIEIHDELTATTPQTAGYATGSPVRDAVCPGGSCMPTRPQRGTSSGVGAARG